MAIESEDESYLSVKDPEGNVIEIRGNGYGVEHLNASIPHWYIRNLIRCTLETKDEMNLLARKITNDSEFDRASEELFSVCKREGIGTESDVFIVSNIQRK